MKSLYQQPPVQSCRRSLQHAGRLLAFLVAGFLTLSGSPGFGALGQQGYVKASNTGEEDQFGRTVAVSGHTMVVGAPEESSNATGVNGDQNNDSATSAGAAYIYVRNGTNWTHQAYLKASDQMRDFAFGRAVAMDGDTVVVGAPLASQGDSGGAAYVFVRNETNWTQQALLKASNQGGYFGAAVSVSGDTIVVGAYTEGSSGTGVNGVQTNYTRAQSGAAYVFVRNGTNWTQQAYLKASNADALDQFGIAVGVSGDTVVIGARLESSNATGVDGSQVNNGSFTAGAAYVFVRDGTNWTQQAYLKAANTGASDFFGSAVSVQGDTIVVGALAEDSSANGVNGDPFNNDLPDSGAAYVFARSDTNWTQQAYLKASNTEAEDGFGFSVALDGGLVVIGTRDEDSSAPGIDGNQADNTGTNSGAAYVFVREGTNWSQFAYVKASNPGGAAEAFDLGDSFGASVGVSGATIAVGAPGEKSNATGVNGDQLDNSLLLAGAAYVFTFFEDEPPVTLNLGFSGNALNLSWTGGAVLEAAEFVTGPWLPETGAVSPHVVGPTNQQNFFRLRLPVP